MVMSLTAKQRRWFGRDALAIERCGQRDIGIAKQQFGKAKDQVHGGFWASGVWKAFMRRWQRPNDTRI